METEKKIIGRCPFCGGNVVKTCKGYRCEHNLGEQPSCVLNINGIIGNRKMNDEEIAELLEKRCILLDGFATKEGKTFPTVLELADDGNILMQSVIGKCPHCGGMIFTSHPISGKYIYIKHISSQHNGFIFLHNGSRCMK